MQRVSVLNVEWGMRSRELVLLLRLVVVRVFVCVWYCFEEAGACFGGGGDRQAVCRRALTRARAGTAGLLYMQHLRQVTFHALRL